MLLHLKTKYQRAKMFYSRHERLLLPATLLGGFAMDYITFANIQIRTALIVSCVHATIATLSIVFAHVYDAGRISHQWKFVRLYAPLITQFTLGALLGNAFIFYWFSASFSVSWPFMGIFVLLMISNEVYKEFFKDIRVQLTLYYFVLFSLLAIILPYAFNSLSFWYFLLAGGASLGWVHILTRLLARASEPIRSGMHSIARACSVVFVGLVSLYVAHIVPPIPLAIREAGVYYNISRTNGSYKFTGEHETLLQRLIPGQSLHWKKGERIYVYTAIFAPTDLTTPIFHRWQWYDPAAGQWKDMDRLSFTISGGRQEGYRGYSSKSGLREGKWRVSVETERAQVLGRIKFRLYEDIE